MIKVSVLDDQINDYYYNFIVVVNQVVVCNNFRDNCQDPVVISDRD